MIPTQLQDALVKELSRLFKDFKLKSPNKNEMVELTILPQDLPIIYKYEDDEENEPFPYMIVKLDSGNIDDGEAHKVKVLILIGIFDNNENKQGYRDVLNIIDRIYIRFGKDRMLDHQYEVEWPFRWQLYEDDTHPYYFGGIEMSFNIPSVLREDDLA